MFYLDRVKYLERYSPYILEVGRTGFVAVSVFTVSAAILEAAYPGFVINWISPKTIIIVGTVFAVLSLWPESNRMDSGLGRLASVVAGVILGMLAAGGSWIGFAAQPEIRLTVTVTVGLSVGLIAGLLSRGRYK